MMSWTEQERARFLRAFFVVSEVYGKEVSELTIEFYIKVLEKYSIIDVIKALEDYVGNVSGKASFFPKPGDIIEIIEGDIEAKAMIAWSKVIEALHSVGTYKSVKFKDPIINTVIYHLGGWIELGKKPLSDIKFIENDFKKMYVNYCKTKKIPEIKYLPGIVETTNYARGLPCCNTVVEIPCEYFTNSKKYIMLERGRYEEKELKQIAEEIKQVKQVEGKESL